MNNEFLQVGKMVVVDGRSLLVMDVFNECDHCNGIDECDFCNSDCGAWCEDSDGDEVCIMENEVEHFGN